MSRNLKMPWSMEDTIENMEHIRDIMIRKVCGINLDGKSEQDVSEVNFDFSRVVEVLKKQIPMTVYHFKDYDTFETSCCGFDVTNQEYNFCPNCGQQLGNVEEIWNTD